MEKKREIEGRKRDYGEMWNKRDGGRERNLRESEGRKGKCEDE